MTVAALKEKMEKELPPPPFDTIEIFQDPDVRKVITEAETITRRMKADEARLKELKPDVEAFLNASGVDKVGLWDGIVLKVGNGKTGSKLSTQKLVEKGVSIDLIAECTEEGSSYTFAQFVYPKPAKVKG